jgi:hypothetical protein
MKCKAGLYYSRPFTSPAQIGGLTNWFDASDPNTLFDQVQSGSLVAPNQMVARFQNKAGVLSNNTQSFRNNNGRGPTRRTGVRNGLDAIEFNGTNNFFYLADGWDRNVPLGIGNIAGSFESTVFIVANALSAPNDSSDSQLNARPLGSLNHSFFGVRSSGSANASATGPLSGGVYPRVTSSVPYVVGQWAIFCAQHTGSTLTARINGVDGNSESLSTRTFFAADYAKLSPSEIAGQDHFNGYIGEIITYSSSISAQSRDEVERYLSVKWGFA